MLDFSVELDVFSEPDVFPGAGESADFFVDESAVAGASAETVALRLSLR